jgi:hypothetical protein
MQAKNIYGWGQYSSILTIAAAGVPEQMSIPTTTNVGTEIVVTWEKPYDSSSLINAYNVYFRTANKQLYQNPACVVTGNPLPTTCSVPITSLIAAPFSLV